MARVISHQTVRLSTGSHSHAASGMCAVELASVLAGEPFSAFPESVCPVIAMFVRYYNDLLDDRRRQELLPYAAHIVGSRGTPRDEARRARLCRRWVTTVARPGLRRRTFWTQLNLRRARRNNAAAAYAALVAAAVPDRFHSDALQLLDDLLAITRAAGARRADGERTVSRRSPMIVSGGRLWR